MPRWTPEPVWKGRDVCIIGGGSSLLNGFDFDLFEDECTIGCNSHYMRGPTICKLCIFGDYDWYLKHKTGLEEYANAGGVVFTNVTQLQRGRLPNWLWVMERSAFGLHRNSLGWNDNTGASAINLALLLGAVKVYLFGFDMRTIDGSPTCHADYPKEPRKDYQQVYNKHSNGLDRVAADLIRFPGQSVINVSDVSALKSFKRMSMKDFVNSRNGADHG